MKQLPPATSRAVCLRLKSVRDEFEFRVLRQNRRVIQDATRKDEIDNFHHVLMDISERMRYQERRGEARGARKYSNEDTEHY